MSLQADIPGDGIKAFSCTLDALAGFGEELQLVAKKSQFVLWALNMSMTGQAVIRISPHFFQQYRLKRPTAQDSGEKLTSLKCRVYLKTLRTIFKKNQNSARPLERCELTMVDNHTDSRLHLKFLCLNGIKKTHSLWYAEADPEEQLYPKNSLHSFSVDPALLNDCLQYFHPRVFDVALECSENVVKIMSYWSETTTALSTEKPMHTEFSLQSADFHRYNVRGTVKLVFNMKEFKTALTFAEDTNTELSARFDAPGRPIIFSTQQAQLMIAEFAVMTHTQDQAPTQVSGRSMTPSVLSGHGPTSAAPAYTLNQQPVPHHHRQEANLTPESLPSSSISESRGRQQQRQQQQQQQPSTMDQRRRDNHHESEEDMPLFCSDGGRVSIAHSNDGARRPSTRKSQQKPSAAQGTSRTVRDSPSLDMLPPEFGRNSTSQDPQTISGGRNELFAFESPGHHDADDGGSSTDDGQEDAPLPKKRGRFFQK